MGVPRVQYWSTRSGPPPSRETGLESLFAPFVATCTDLTRLVHVMTLINKLRLLGLGLGLTTEMAPLPDDLPARSNHFF